jgi:hypothetical protein
MLKSLEHHEHAEHMTHHGADHGGHAAAEHASEQSYAHSSQMAALLVAILAATLAITEEGAKHAEVKVQVNSVYATDAWAQYQAKSTRSTLSQDLAEVVGVLDGSDPTMAEKRQALLKHLKQDQDKFENDPKDGKHAIFIRARAFEEDRDHAMEAMHSYHNGSAALELGIVLSTASAITRSKMLIYAAVGLGIAGAIFSLLGWLAPEYGAF